MGGNALSSTVPVRLTKREADRLAADCVVKLQALYPGRRVAYMSSYRSKPDAGDADILVEGGDGYDPHQAAAALDAVEVVRNGPVTSVGVIVHPEVPQRDGNVFQVDLIKSAPEEFDYASNYFMWSDLGNLIGRIAHAGFTAHKHNGLYFYFRDQDYMFREIVLTRDYGRALEYLGYDPVLFSKGFDTLKDIFEFTASSTFFNRDIFLLENRNAVARVRDKKRPAYMGFLKWCEARPELPGYAFSEDKTSWLPRLFEFFPEFKAQYDQAVIDLARQRELKARFSGDFVSRITGLQGKELGGFMKRFKESFESPEAMHAFILSNDEATLTAKVQAACL